LKASGGLGQPGLLVDLFDYLVKTTLEGRSPKESEIAIEVFGRAPDFNSTEDATIRVYVHRLRKKMAQAYAEGTATGPQIVLPRGEYRLEMADDRPGTMHASAWRHRLALLLAGGVGGALLGVATLSLLTPVERDPRSAAKEALIWAELTHSSRPTSVVLGDYVIQRPEREPGALLMPVATGSALQKLLPLLSGPESQWGPPRVISMSETTPDRIKLSNIVYVGPLDTMGEIAAPWQSVSHLRHVGPDEWRVASSGAKLDRDRTEIDVASGAHRDYAYIATFPGPSDTRIVIVSGLDGAGIAQAAEIATAPGSIAEIARRIGKARDFEALYDVRAMGTTNVGAALVYASPIKAEGMWSGGQTPP